MEKIEYKRFLIIRDGFYNEPIKVMDAAKNAEYFEPKNITGRRSLEVYHPSGIKRKLEKILGIKITRWTKDPMEGNGVFYQGFSRGKWREIPGVHSDKPFNNITVLIYLTLDIPIECGTSFWMHKDTQLIDPPMLKDSKKLKIKISELRDILETECYNRSKWTEIDRVGYKFNRMIAYPSGVFHSASKHYGSSIENGRLYQTFRIGVDWNSFKVCIA